MTEYSETCTAIHEALCMGLQGLAEALRAERDRLETLLIADAENML